MSYRDCFFFLFAVLLRLLISLFFNFTITCVCVIVYLNRLYADKLKEHTVGPRLIGSIGTEDFSPLSQVHLQREVKSH